MFSHSTLGYPDAMSAPKALAVLTAVLAALATGGCGGSGGAETTGEPGEIAFDLPPANDGGVSGVRATLKYKSRDRTQVTVDGLDEGESAGGGPNPVWLRSGSCDDLGRVISTLKPLEGSTTSSVVGVGLTALLNGDYAVAVGLTKQQPEAVACGDVPDTAPDASGP
jgi:hypothetical protein